MSCLTVHHNLTTVLLLIPLAAVAISAAAPTLARADTGTGPVLDAVGTGSVSATAAPSSPSLGNSICTAVQQPGETMASIASALAVRDGTSPRMSKVLTGLAISIYCPTMMSTLPADDWLSLLGSGS